MFRVVSAPIVRSTYNYLQHLVFVKPLLLLATFVEAFLQLFHDSVMTLLCFSL